MFDTANMEHDEPLVLSFYIFQMQLAGHSLINNYSYALLSAGHCRKHKEDIHKGMALSIQYDNYMYEFIINK